MGGRIHLSERIWSQQSVDLCGRDGGMSQQLLHNTNVSAAGQEMGRKGVAQRVR